MDPQLRPSAAEVARTLRERRSTPCSAAGSTAAGEALLAGGAPMAAAPGRTGRRRGRRRLPAASARCTDRRSCTGRAQWSASAESATAVPAGPNCRPMPPAAADDDQPSAPHRRAGTPERSGRSRPADRHPGRGGGPDRRADSRRPGADAQSVDEEPGGAARPVGVQRHQSSPGSADAVELPDVGGADRLGPDPGGGGSAGSSTSAPPSSTPAAQQRAAQQRPGRQQRAAAAAPRHRAAARRQRPAPPASARAPRPARPAAPVTTHHQRGPGRCQRLGTGTRPARQRRG